MRIVFMGTPEYGVPSLKALIAAGHEVAGVFTQPDKPKGRGNATAAGPVKRYALEKGIPVFQPVKTRVDGVEPLRRLAPDLCVTAAFGHILSQEVLDIPRYGTVNVHASLLPKYRGSAPVNYAVMMGETKTGVTTMMTNKGMDTGDILLQREAAIGEEETAGELIGRLAVIGAELLVETIWRIERGDCPRTAQDESKASYFPLLKKETGIIDFTKSAREIACHVRGVTPWPAAYAGVYKLLAVRAEPCGAEAPAGTVLEADEKNGLLVKAGEGAVRILRLQTAGGKPMDAKDYLRGHKIAAGEWIDGGKHAE